MTSERSDNELFSDGVSSCGILRH